MLDRLGAHFLSRATIQAPGGPRTSSGAVASGWVSLAGMTSLGCAVAPVSGSERERAQGATTETTHSILLQGRYEAISPRHRVVVTGSAAGVYDILVSMTDAQGVVTRLFVRRGSPTANEGS